ncbi:DUF448 domain-containing protein [Helicobacter cholecystus]|uniref:DUF448 domain-containing protein n=1 Tax=Helicobacter cholecystus TaxID=45498 RepID=A0A3D8IYG5_9HELI|nr:DUF448 domain-containing protein [Helicobacter cholecystus]RDU69955.1 DUF448 domain-containing protein [Helicobacter cholecystus]VEJ24879.1 nucleic acid binding transriptional terminator [Helicobacter cholecystus]
MLKNQIQKSFKLASPKSQRMCVCCRKKFLQSEILRFFTQENSLKIFEGKGRSFYVCLSCLSEPRNLDKILKIKRIHTTENLLQLKEIVALCQSQSKILQ